MSTVWDFISRTQLSQKCLPAVPDDALLMLVFRNFFTKSAPPLHWLSWRSMPASGSALPVPPNPADVRSTQRSGGNSDRCCTVCQGLCEDSNQEGVASQKRTPFWSCEGIRDNFQPLKEWVRGEQPCGDKGTSASKVKMPCFPPQLGHSPSHLLPKLPFSFFHCNPLPYSPNYQQMGQQKQPLRQT